MFLWHYGFYFSSNMELTLFVIRNFLLRFIHALFIHFITLFELKHPNNVFLSRKLYFVVIN